MSVTNIVMVLAFIPPSVIYINYSLMLNNLVGAKRWMSMASANNNIKKMKNCHTGGGFLIMYFLRKKGEWRWSE